MPTQTALQRWTSLCFLALFASVLLHYAVPFVVFRIARHAELGREDAQHQREAESLQRMAVDQLTTIQRLGHEIPKSVVRIQSANDSSVSTGFGVIVDTRALAVTSCSLLEDRNEVLILVPGQSEPISSNVVARDDVSDVALIEFVPPSHEQLAVRPISKRPPRLGENVFALSDASTLRSGLQIGMILGRGTNTPRLCLHEVDLIGTDISTEQNVGSPLVNIDGDILGICIANLACQSDDRGFALPALAANHILTELMQFGRVRRGWIGAFLHADVLRDKPTDQTRVAHVDYVVPGSPADRAGLRAGDDILLMTQYLPVIEVSDLQRLILATLPPEVLQCSIVRQNRFDVLSIPVETQPILAPSLPGEREWGFQLYCAQNRLQLEPDAPANGVAVTSVTPVLAAAGILPGDIITALNDTPTPNIETYCRQASATIAARQGVRVELWRKGSPQMRVVDVPWGAKQ